MKKLWILVIVLICATGIPISAAPWTEYRITTSPANQSYPHISGNIVVWWDGGGSPILGADITDPAAPIYFELPANPKNPYGDIVGGDIVVNGFSKTCGDGKKHYGVSAYNLSTETESIVKDPCPELVPYANYGSASTDGLTVVYADSSKIYGYDLYWQSEFEVPDSLTYGGPKVDGSLIIWNVAGVAVYLFDTTKWQTFQVSDTPANWLDISSSTVVGQIGQDIYGFDVSDPCNPIEFPVCTDENEQWYPAISGNIIVWQDDRNGNWDIYGYDISTQTEFQITTNTADQTSPAISGHTVVWEDKRHGQSDIYASILYGPEVPRCTEKLQGDLDNDCKVDYKDFATFAQNWLDCNLDPPSACWN